MAVVITTNIFLLHNLFKEERGEVFDEESLWPKQGGVL